MARGRGGRVPWWGRGRGRGTAAIVDNGYFTSPTNAAGVGQFRGSRGAGRGPGRYMFTSPGYRGNSFVWYFENIVLLDISTLFIIKPLYHGFIVVSLSV